MSFIRGMFLFTKCCESLYKERCVWAGHIAGIEVCDILVETHSRNK